MYEKPEVYIHSIGISKSIKADIPDYKALKGANHINWKMVDCKDPSSCIFNETLPSKDGKGRVYELIIQK